MRSHRKTFALLLVVWIALLRAGPAAGASLVPRDLRQMVAASPEIIHATALVSQCRWNDDHTLIITETRFRVLGTIRGAPEPEVMVTTPGGKIGKLLVEVP